jgi:trk system potassium uptake protein TrkA
VQTFAVIGLGRFGSRLAATLAASGHEVVAVDLDPHLVEDIRDRVTHAVALDATDRRALERQGIDKADAVIVAIGNDFEATTLTTVTLKQMGAKRVIARAASQVSARVLSLVGADEVVNPEDEAADRWAHRLLNPQFINQIEFHHDHSIVEVRAPAAWIGKSLVELELRQRLKVHVVAIRRRGEDRQDRIELPGPQTPLAVGDILILMGKDEDLAKLPRE